MANDVMDFGIRLTGGQLMRLAAQHFVQNLYVAALGRPADKEGLTYWTDHIIKENVSASEVAKSFLTGREFMSQDLDDEDFVETLYMVYYNRIGTYDEVNTWESALAAGTPREDLITAFASSSEWANECLAYGINV
jgi:hypothetical protein